MAHRLWVQRNERFVIFRIFSIPGTQRYPRFKNCAVPSGTQLLKFARYPVPSGTQLLKFAWYPVPSGTQFLKFPRYPVPSGTQIFKISMGTGRYPGTHGYRGTARADPWFTVLWLNHQCHCSIQSQQIIVYFFLIQIKEQAISLIRLEKKFPFLSMQYL